MSRSNYEKKDGPKARKILSREQEFELGHQRSPKHKVDFEDDDEELDEDEETS